MARRFFVWLHRWVGLLMTVFLIVVGLTGSLLAFNTDMEKLVSPQLFASPPVPDAKQLDFATLAELAQIQEPHAIIGSFLAGDEQILMYVGARTDSATGKPYPLDFDQMFVDPWTGRELGHRRYGYLSQGMINLMPFIYDLHDTLALGVGGAWVLGIVALAWTIDCFYAFYLTFPVVFSRFFSRWKPAWKIKWSASAYRLNFDLHRASGLWLWPLLFIFAWSSVMFNLGPVYDWTTARLFDVQNDDQKIAAYMLKTPNENPRIGWQEAQGRAEQLMAQAAKEKGFLVKGAAGFGYMPEMGAYTYVVRSNRSVSDRNWDEPCIWFNGDTGALMEVFMPVGEHSGNTVTNWLRALHFANWHNWLTYRILVCILGLVITLLSVTGVYIWYKKWKARRSSKKHARLVEEEARI